MRRTLAAFLLTVAAVSAVAMARRAPGPLAAGVPSYRALGPVRAKVAVVAFSDFQCPNCAKAEPLLRALADRHPTDVRLYFRHNPLRMHKWARDAARAAEAAGRQGRFWPYATILFERQKDWSGDAGPGNLFAEYAREAGLDVDRFRKESADPRWEGLIDEDKQAARAANVEATPTVFIGDQRRVGASQVEADGERLVQEAMR